MASGGRQPDVDLEGVVDEPAEARQRTDHQDPDRQTVPHANEADALVDAAQRAANGLRVLLLVVDLGHHDVCRMGHHCTENTSDVAAQKGNSGAAHSGVRRSRFSQVQVDQLHRLLETGKLTHGVGDASEPQGHQSFIQTPDALDSGDFFPPVNHTVSVRRNSRARSDLDCLERTQGDVSKKLRGRRRGQEHSGLVFIGGFRADHIRICLLEVFVETVLTGTLQGVANEGSTETREN